jgi:hypothetical protein
MKTKVERLRGFLSDEIARDLWMELATRLRGPECAGRAGDVLSKSERALYDALTYRFACQTAVVSITETPA